MAATASTSSLIMVDDGDEVTNPPTTRSPTPVPAQNNDVTDWLMNESPSEFVETRRSREVKDGEIDKKSDTRAYTSIVVSYSYKQRWVKNVLSKLFSKTRILI
ncbi:hypothetical protein QAD02_006468 [Eretmocerus hayati]|uniref:Uncharacterized protein n=1 Tax=Eretmocerus hayati TaxID=131215 RepID=A0ACC2N1B2_9HYME|nr:hypothetical protein QAD02_006468 [Eretmocerus hayati]